MENDNKKLPENQFWGIKPLPNSITCLNLFSGCLAVSFGFQGD